MEGRLAGLRALMRQEGVNAWIIPSQDPHNSEYVAPFFAVREWFSGFTGSAGTLVVTLEAAVLWTDSRYALQAARELEGLPVSYFVEGQPDCPDMGDWLVQTLGAGARVCFDARVMTWEVYAALERRLGLQDVRLVPSGDPAATLWKDRPPMPASPLENAPGPGPMGGRKGRLDQLLKTLAVQSRDWILLSALDQIAWLLGLRGHDISYNPLFLAYFLAGPKGMVLFTDLSRVDPAIATALSEDGVSLADYRGAGAWLQTLASGDRILLPPESSNVHICQNAGHLRIFREASPVDRWKAVLEPWQIESLRETCVADGACLVGCLAPVAQGQVSLDEYGLGLRIAAARCEVKSCRGESFAPICGWKDHGAVVHYRAPATGSAPIEGPGLLLVDCGGQYDGGTTDITRVFAMGGSPDEEERRVYTLVLKGHLRLARIRFPRGTSGPQLDVLARMSLWEEGLDYGHGTGHGIGFGLCVHEGPQRISPRGSREPLVPGMVLSNEPGCYREGRFGIRIENMLLVVPDTDHEGFLRFETLSLFPFERDLVDPALLTQGEKEWIDRYHEGVWNGLSRKLDREAKAWLKEKTRPL